MQVVNYALAGGNTTLKEIRAGYNKSESLQIWYNGLVSATVKIEAWVSTNNTKPFVKHSEKTLVAGSASEFLILDNIPMGFYIQFRITAEAATAGTITEIDSPTQWV